MKNNLVVLTSGFPFDDREPFFETELFVIAEAFNQVIIVPIDNLHSETLRPLPKNCSVLVSESQQTNFSLFSLLETFFSFIFFKELFEIVFNPQFGFSIKRIKTAIVSFLHAKKLKSFLKHSGCVQNDTVFYSFWTDDAGIALALLKREYPEISCFTRAHGWDLYFNTSTLHYLPFRWLITQQMNGIVTDSKAGTDYIRSHWSGAKYCSIQPSFMGVKTQSEFNMFSKDFVVVSCSHLVDVKRIHLLAEVLVLIGKEIPVKWVHFGDGPEMVRVQNILKKEPASLLKAIFKGHTPNEEIIKWYTKNNVTVFVNVSESEGIPVSIMEAMSFGIPVIATNVGGNGEIVMDDNGRLIPVNFHLSELFKALMDFNDFKIDVYTEFCKRAKLIQQKYYQDKINYSRFIKILKNH